MEAFDWRRYRRSVVEQGFDLLTSE